MTGLPRGWAEQGGGGETAGLPGLSTKDCLQPPVYNVPERISPTSSDTQGELVAEVTTGQLTLTPAGGPADVLMIAAPVLGSARARLGALPPDSVPGGRGSSIPQVGAWGPQTGSRAHGKSRMPSLCSPRLCSSQMTQSPLFLPLCLPPSSPASAGGAESGSLPTPGSAMCERAGQRGLRGGRP